jgi:hypothetical protein
MESRSEEPAGFASSANPEYADATPLEVTPIEVQPGIMVRNKPAVVPDNQSPAGHTPQKLAPVGADGPSADAKPPGKRVRSKPETRAQLLDRLINPTISLHEASIILDVCTATVRRYTDMGLLPHQRTEGGQRRFRLRDVLALSRELDKKGRS